MRGFRSREAGFTLIEIVVTLAILGIIAAIAIPNYTQYVTRSNRAAAKQILLEVAGELERRYTSNGCYNRGSPIGCRDSSGATLSISRTQAPADGAARYTIAVNFPTPQEFTLTATPVPAGADPECGNLSLSHTGQRTISGTGTVATCWR